SLVICLHPPPPDIYTLSLHDALPIYEVSEFKVPLQRLSNVTAELQEGVMKTRMQPIGNAWQKLPRIVRDLAQELGKDIDLQMTGDRKSTRLNSSHVKISYAVFCLKKK